MNQNNPRLCRLSKIRMEQGLSFQIYKGDCSNYTNNLPLKWLTKKPVCIEQWPLTKEKKYRHLSSWYKSSWRLSIQKSLPAHGIPSVFVIKKEIGEMEDINRFDSGEKNNPTSGSITAWNSFAFFTT